MKTIIQNIEPFVRNVTMRIEEKTKILYHQILKTLTMMFQHTKIELMLSSDPETLVKLITCSKYLKK